LATRWPAGGLRVAWSPPAEAGSMKAPQGLPFELAGSRAQGEREDAAVRSTPAIESAADDRGGGIPGAGLLERPQQRRLLVRPVEMEASLPRDIVAVEAGDDAFDKSDCLADALGQFKGGKSELAPLSARGRSSQCGPRTTGDMINGIARNAPSYGLTLFPNPQSG
jgi:hypothetical protein